MWKLSRFLFLCFLEEAIENAVATQGSGAAAVSAPHCPHLTVPTSLYPGAPATSSPILIVAQHLCVEMKVWAPQQ